MYIYICIHVLYCMMKVIVLQLYNTYFVFFQVCLINYTMLNDFKLYHVKLKLYIYHIKYVLVRFFGTIINGTSRDLYSSSRLSSISSQSGPCWLAKLVHK